MEPQPFVKKRVMVDAVQLTEDADWEAIATWCGGHLRNCSDVPGVDTVVRPATCLVIPTMEGSMLAREGDWIVRGVVGEFYPVRVDVFRKSYDPA